MARGWPQVRDVGRNTTRWSTALGPILWREYTTDLPECVRGAGAGVEDQSTGENEISTDPRKDEDEGRHPTQDWSLSEWIDSKPDQGIEEEHDANLRKKGARR